MTNFHVYVQSPEIDSKMKERVLAACYKAILSWPAIPEKNKPIAGDLGREAGSGSADKVSDNIQVSEGNHVNAGGSL